MIRKQISLTGELYVYMNGELLYKKWKDGNSILFEEYGLNTRNTDRDRSSYGGVHPDDDSSGLAISTERLADMLVSLLDDDLDGASKAGVKALFLAVVDLLYWIEDKGGAEVDPPVIREHLEIDRLLTLVSIHPGMPMAIRKQLDAYVWSLHVQTDVSAGTLPEERHRKWQSLLDELLAKLQEVYGHLFNRVFDTERPEAWHGHSSL
jgi:hypothetical protein